MAQWFLISYDVSNPKRLRRIHRRLRREGLAVQESVFLAELSRREQRKLMGELGTLIDEKEDDLRCYPSPHPARIWMSSARHAGGTASGDPEEPARWIASLAPLVARGRTGFTQLQARLARWQQRG